MIGVEVREEGRALQKLGGGPSPTRQQGEASRDKTRWELGPSPAKHEVGGAEPHAPNARMEEAEPHASRTR